ncbi:outer membrane protein W [Aquimarina sp. EL_43]|uniref:hypothetical protein n=1 Tax=unclassified Aquimarina TaxID=2627091 RepID=UPI0018C935CC|nr:MULTISPECIES: hypothetical protein [unclassified Aquimarina]MBG6133745.1 outer membrane protein W [Aquimarina sp. EL_35]MBG6153916.1 outer membrane protein W [Aquimarina sp. EL_32]MBG6172136.1 outer membrane protein W [Aquimarina sp. EL_43]
MSWSIPKQKLVLITLVFCLFNLNAQEKSNITFRIEPGILLFSESGNLELLLNVEPKIKISENKVIGLRFGVALNSQKFENNDSAQFNIDDQSDNAVISFVPTFDYYLNENNYRPYVGLGVGYYLLSYIDVSPVGSADVLEGSVNNQIGFLLRGGFEFGKTRLGLEYNLIPKADIELPSGQIIGTVDSGYLGLSIGFTIGGRKNQN